MKLLVIVALAFFLVTVARSIPHNPDCPKVYCPDIYRPVCGLKGRNVLRLFHNLCRLKATNCDHDYYRPVSMSICIRMNIIPHKH